MNIKKNIKTLFMYYVLFFKIIYKQTHLLAMYKY